MARSALRKDIRIALMGATGSGKSAFINLASGSGGMVVGHSLRSCTSEVQTSKEFLLDGRAVTLIDTPGFDDTTRSDTDILSCIAAYLSSTYKQGYKLAGVIYMHRISDPRMGGTSTRNFRMFRSLCGDGVLPNVVIVTNMWGNVDPKIGEERERELANNDKFFKPVLKKGARLIRHHGTQASAQAILRDMFNNEERTLLIQYEIVHQHKDLIDTAAGAELDHDLRDQAERHREELKKLHEEMEDAARVQDEETKLELQEELDRERERLECIKRDSERLVADFTADKSRLASKLAQMSVDSYHQGVQVSEEVKMRSQLGPGPARDEVEDLSVNGPEERRKARELAEPQHDIHSLQDKKKKPEEDAQHTDSLENARANRERTLALRMEVAQPQLDVTRQTEEAWGGACSRAPLGSAKEQMGTVEQEHSTRRERNAELHRDHFLAEQRQTKSRTHSYAENGVIILPAPRRILLCDVVHFPFPKAGDPICYGASGHVHPIFLGSAIFRRTVQPCKVVPYLRPRCYVPWGNSEIEYKYCYDLLPFNPRTMEWVPTSHGVIPPHHTPVDGGHEKNGAKLYHALAFVYGLKIPGRTGEHLRGCNVSYYGEGYIITEYDILCWK